MQVVRGHGLPSEEDAFVCETVPGPDPVSVASENYETLEQDVDEVLNLATPDLENTELRRTSRCRPVSELQ